MKKIVMLFVVACTITLAACGGGGGGGGSAGLPNPPAPVGNSNGLDTSVPSEIAEAAATNDTNLGSVTQSSNGTNIDGTPTTTDKINIAINTGNSAIQIRKESRGGTNWTINNNYGELDLYYIDLDDDSSDGPWHREREGPIATLVEQVSSPYNRDSYVVARYNTIFNGSSDWVVGGVWSVAVDYDDKMGGDGGHLANLKREVDPSSHLRSDAYGTVACTSPCRIVYYETGAYADGPEWDKTMPAGGSAVYIGTESNYRYFNNDNDPYDDLLHGGYGDGGVSLNVSFGGARGTWISGALGNAFNLGATRWDPTRGEHGAFYSRNKLSCVAGDFHCDTIGESIFAAQFFGDNEDAPNLIGGTFSARDIRTRICVFNGGYTKNCGFGGDGENRYYTGFIVGGFTGVTVGYTQGYYPDNAANLCTPANFLCDGVGPGALNEIPAALADLAASNLPNFDGGVTHSSNNRLSNRTLITSDNINITGGNNSYSISKQGQTAADSWTLANSNLSDFAYFSIDTDDDSQQGDWHREREGDRAVLVDRIANDGSRYALSYFNDISNDTNNWVVGGIWGVLRDYNGNLQPYLAGEKANVDPTTFLVTGAVDVNCNIPCYIHYEEAGAFADGAEWDEDLPASGSATYIGTLNQFESLVNPNDASDYDFFGTSHGGISLVVDFGGSNDTSISGALGTEFDLSATDWDASKGAHGAFYGVDKISCAAGAYVCQTITGDSIFAAQFFGENDSTDGNKPNLLGGTFSVDGVQYTSGSITYEGAVIGGFTGEKQ